MNAVILCIRQEAHWPKTFTAQYPVYISWYYIDVHAYSLRKYQLRANLTRFPRNETCANISTFTVTELCIFMMDETCHTINSHSHYYFNNNGQREIENQHNKSKKRKCHIWNEVIHSWEWTHKVHIKVKSQSFTIVTFSGYRIDNPGTLQVFAHR